MEVSGSFLRKWFCSPWGALPISLRKVLLLPCGNSCRPLPWHLPSCIGAASDFYQWPIPLSLLVHCSSQFSTQAFEMLESDHPLQLLHSSLVQHPPSQVD
ncbi:hypothetical protein AAHE18_15G173600 [Arachis hypogaea]